MNKEIPHRSIVAIDIGGTSIRALIIRNEKRIRRDHVFDTSQNVSNEMTQVAAFFDEIGNLAEAPSSVGVASAATVGPCGSVTDWSNRPQWIGLELKSLLEHRFRGSVEIEDDGNAAAIAEASIRTTASLFYVGVGTGVGGGYVSDGLVHRGTNGQASNIGHIPLGPYHAVCTCGRRRCVQAVSSGRAFLSSLSNDLGISMNAEYARSLVTAGNPTAIRTLNLVAEVVALAIVTVDRLLDPETMVLGGGFAQAYPELLPLVNLAIEREGHGGKSITVMPSFFGKLSSLVGAQILATRLANDCK